MVLKTIRLLVKILLYAFVLLIVVLLVSDLFVQFRMSDKEINDFFGKKNLYPQIAYYHTHGREIRYLHIGKDTATTILFIHGAPSSLTYWNEYLTDSALLQKANMYAVDRPGYGSSGFGKPLTNIATQAACIAPILDSLNRIHHPVILVAASYGTAVASRLAMDYPQLVDGIVLLAPAIAPGEERIFFFTYIIENPLLNWFIPRMFKSANAEKVHHKEELTKMLPLWKNIKVPVIYMQGSNDGLVYITNATFAKQHLLNVPSLLIEFLKGRGHLIAFAEKEKIEKNILKMIDIVHGNIGNQSK